MQSRPAGFLFYCDADPRTGRGHLSRCASLARQLRTLRPGAPLVFTGRYDAFARALLRRYGLGRRGPAPTPALRRLASRFEWLVVDSYRLRQRDIDALAGGPFKLAVIDDFQPLDVARADLVVNFTAGAEKRRYGTAAAALGLRYFPAKQELRSIRLANRRPPRRAVKEVLVALSGSRAADALLAPALRALDASLAGGRIRYLAASPVRLRLTGRNRVERLVPDPAIERRLADADLVVSGGGLLRYESGYCRIPNASISLNEGQRGDTRRLAGLRVTLDLGSSRGFRESEARRRLSSFLGDPAARAAQWRASRRVFDADSPLRLARMLSAR